MKIIVGLGNPGTKYKYTRHNIGFEAVYKLATDHGIELKNHSRFRAFVGEGRIGGQVVMLVLPMTYMNLSGESVRAILNFYKLTPADIIVAYDDVNLPVGDIRVRERGSAAGQKGMINIIAQLKTDEFVRVRLGVGEKPPGFTLSDYVLSRFLKEEVDGVVQGIIKACDAMEIILKEDAIAAMNKYNKKMTPPKENKKDNNND